MESTASEPESLYLAPSARSRIRQKIPEKIQWVKPKLVCEVAFAEWTEDEQMRQTTFLSLREDKDPKEVVREV